MGWGRRVRRERAAPFYRAVSGPGWFFCFPTLGVRLRLHAAQSSGESDLGVPQKDSPFPGTGANATGSHTCSQATAAPNTVPATAPRAAPSAVAVMTKATCYEPSNLWHVPKPQQNPVSRWAYDTNPRTIPPTTLPKIALCFIALGRLLLHCHADVMSP